MFYEKGNIVELEDNKRYFIYDQTDYNNRKFLLLVNVDNNDDIDIFELSSKDNDAFISEVEDTNLKAELSTIFEKNNNENSEQ